MDFITVLPVYERPPEDYVAEHGQPPPELTVYHPEPETATGIAVVCCPGGGYGHVGLARGGHRPARWLASLGHVGIVLRYRHAPYRHPVPLRDLRAALGLVRRHGSEWGIHPKGLAVAGFSAGGHLALCAAALPALAGEEHPPRPDLLLLAYPVVSLTEPFAHRRSRDALLGEGADDATARSVSPDHFIEPGFPPTFCFHAGDDTEVPVENSLLLYQKIHAAGAKAELHLFPSGGHGFGLGAGALHPWTGLADRWLRQRLRELDPG